MAPGMGIKAPVPRTRTGCLTCRKRKVKCDEVKPVCERCTRLQRECIWSGDDLQLAPCHRPQPAGSASISIATSTSAEPSLQLSSLSGQNFVVEFPNLNRHTVSYMHHFITFCCRFLAYSNDNEGNPFQEDLIPLASSSPALLHSMTAVAASHLSRGQPQHLITAANSYALALRELNATLSDPVVARSDSTLGACLLLCVYESDNSLWLEHLQGARDLILYRGGPKASDYLTRFFSLLDISGSLSSGGGPLIQGNYWLEDGPDQDPTSNSNRRRWPYYDDGNVMTNLFHELMVFMAKLSRLSAQSMSDLGGQQPENIVSQAAEIRRDLFAWWQQCPPALRDQSNAWRTQARPRKLTVPETLEEEAFSSTKSCMDGCIIYLNHILDPEGLQPQKPEVIEAVIDILEIANEMPRGYGLEMGLYWGLFMAGIAIFNDEVAEELIRQKLKADIASSIYHPDRALDLLEVLWKRQHQYGRKFDWRQVQIQMDIHMQVFR
ncbi:C6 transcription factor OefC [Drepanopeziza brunnea f. sp. 'multigermtubi' MB_m1]|uniref:C6 transcription factor OefC n=1 Tax=Marssonina brunnea f. sp. multigermtubi (strain MB_m1) TaxID=1072389 RepID=K1WU47_MARBU|nr:C6 transcription factor OefC [Drepanopeziza brunnea f. sp. 'multigermtubi' MB_m1]EKD21140.1 C6 transcription factor OefC [Drepanopeziza brunnea f. sp. 'multigermtubi' MB_m1]